MLFNDFDNFLKGGANTFKGGFPPVYSVEEGSDSLREFNPNLVTMKLTDTVRRDSKVLTKM